VKRLERTAQAVREYDRVNAGYRANGKMTLEEVEAALRKVREAFAEDTKDINSRDNAMLVHPDGDGWLRKMLVNEGFKDCGLTKAIRSQRGWGW